MTMTLTGFDENGEPIFEDIPDEEFVADFSGVGADNAPLPTQWGATEIENSSQPGQEGYGWRYFSDGTAIDPDGKMYSSTDVTDLNTGVTSKSTTPISGANSGVVNALLGAAKSSFMKKDAGGNEVVDWNAVTKAAAGVTGAYAGVNAANNIQHIGYQGQIPKYTAVRQAVQGTYDPSRRPGSAGQRYFTDVNFAGAGLGATEAAQKATQEQAAALRQANQQNPAQQKLAEGGIADGRYLRGDTDGMADEIYTSIDGQQDAQLSHGEFVVPADVVSHLGNGNSDAGAKKLYQMMDKIRVARTGTKKQGKEIDADNFMPGGLASAYANGGEVKRFAAGDVVPAAAGSTYESNLSNWVGPYVTDMLGKGQALADQPYQAYQGPLTAGTSGLQQQAFQQAGNLQVPSSVGQAAATVGGIAGQMQNLNYQPTQFQSQYQAPQAYQAGQFDNAFNAPKLSDATQFTNQYKAPDAYQAAQFGADTFGAQQAQQYMNPYLQAALDPQIAEARRQAQISRMADASRLTQAGAFGGSRQAIMESEGNRNLGTNLANITGTGYNTAYQNAMSQFNADQARKQSAQQATEQSRQFGANQAATAAQLQAQFGMSAQQAQEAARQFNQGQNMTAAQLQAQFGMTAQQAQEASRQFGAQQGLASAQAAAQFGSAAQQAAEQSRQFGAQYGLQGLQGALSAAQAQGALGAQENQLSLANLAQISNLGQIQRGIESEGIAADRAQFEAERDNPYKMVQFQQSLLSGLPLATQGSATASTNAVQDAAAGSAALIKKLQDLGIIKP